MLFHKPQKSEIERITEEEVKKPSEFGEIFPGQKKQPPIV